MKKTILALAITSVIGFSGCTQAPEDAQTTADSSPTQESAQQTAATNQPEIGEWGFDLTTMDTEAVPGDDFNRYVNGSWLDTFEIPADRSNYGIFAQLRERSTDQVKDIIEDLASTESSSGSLEAKVGDYYATWMDTGSINEKGIAPLQPLLDEIAAIEDHAGVLAQMSTLHATAPFGMGIIPDPADTTKYTLFASQAGLGLPDRDYYLTDEERFENYRGAYKAYIAELFSLAGIEGGEQKAQDIFAIEKRLAEVHWTRAESRDIQKIYNPMPPSQLAEMAPEIDWLMVMDYLGLKDMDNIVVAQPSALQASAKIFAETDVSAWKDYLVFHLISDHSPYLSEEFDKATFNFYSTALRGVPEQRERWKRGSDLVNANLGEAVGKIYVGKFFPEAAKTEMDSLVKNLTRAFEQRIKQNQWMDEQTRQQALTKLSTFEPRIGYTSKWTDYGPLEIEKGDMIGNTMRLREFAWQRQLDDLKGPVDRQRWPYPPQTVNASYNPLMNQITFPAGILQPPFFDLNADPAINYGAIGAVIGHEIGHGFDDQGRRFDETGKIRDWWTETANANFQQRADKLVAQYDTYSPIEGMNVNGRLALGENIGDLGGMEMAYSAYQLYVAENGEPPVIDGFTGTQRFFMAWAQVWRAKMREDAMRQQLTTGPHSPPQYRINGVVRNMDAWYDAFGVTEDNALYLPPEERVSIW